MHERASIFLEHVTQIYAARLLIWISDVAKIIFIYGNEFKQSPNFPAADQIAAVNKVICNFAQPMLDFVSIWMVFAVLGKGDCCIKWWCHLGWAVSAPGKYCKRRRAPFSSRRKFIYFPIVKLMPQRLLIYCTLKRARHTPTIELEVCGLWNVASWLASWMRKDAENRRNKPNQT